MKLPSCLAFGLVLALIPTLVVMPRASAEAGINYISVEPASLNFELSAKEKDRVAMLTIHNKYKTSLRMTAQLRGIDETAGKIVPTGDPTQAISKTLKLSETEFLVPASSDYFLRIAAHDDGSLPAGGHYATLLLSEKSHANGKNAIQPQLSVGIFLVKQEGSISNVLLTQHEINKSLLGYPDSASIEILNEGNIHQVPRASVRILDKSGAVLSEGIFNQESKILLPGTKLSQTIAFVSPKRQYIPKRLTLEIRYRADGIDNATIYQKQFWYVPLVDQIALGAVVIALIISALIKRKAVAKTLRTLKRPKAADL